MPQTLLIVLLIAAVGVILYLLFRLFQSKASQSANSAPDQSLSLLQSQMHELTRTLDARLGESSEVMRSQIGQNSDVIHKITKDVLQNLGSVREELVRVGESNKQVVSIGDQLKSFQDILKNPKQRGTLGEYHLEVALQNILPTGAYQMQYPFQDGTKVDAVIFFAEKVIPIDSKFSLENYQRFCEAQTDEERKRYEQALSEDLKTRIDETSKYIKPGEDTMDFAFMFIPSEALYYDLLINKVGNSNTRNLIEYAVGERRVHVVSPTTIYAYLQTIIQGLRQMEINKSSEKLRKNIGDLQVHLKKYEQFMQKLGNHLGSSASMYTQAYREFKKIDKDIFKITGETIGVEPIAISAPRPEDEEDETETESSEKNSRSVAGLF